MPASRFGRAPIRSASGLDGHESGVAPASRSDRWWEVTVSLEPLPSPLPPHARPLSRFEGRQSGSRHTRPGGVTASAGARRAAVARWPTDRVISLSAPANTTCSGTSARRDIGGGAEEPQLTRRPLRPKAWRNVRPASGLQRRRAPPTPGTRHLTASRPADGTPVDQQSSGACLRNAPLSSRADWPRSDGRRHGTVRSGPVNTNGSAAPDRAPASIDRPPARAVRHARSRGRRPGLDPAPADRPGSLPRPPRSRTSGSAQRTARIPQIPPGISPEVSQTGKLIPQEGIQISDRWWPIRRPFEFSLGVI